MRFSGLSCKFISIYVCICVTHIHMFEAEYMFVYLSYSNLFVACIPSKARVVVLGYFWRCLLDPLLTSQTTLFSFNSNILIYIYIIYI